MTFFDSMRQAAFQNFHFPPPLLRPFSSKQFKCFDLNATLYTQHISPIGCGLSWQGARGVNQEVMLRQYSFWAHIEWEVVRSLFRH